MTSSYNCQGKIFKKENDKFQSITVNSIKAIDDCKDIAIKKDTSRYAKPTEQTKNLPYRYDYGVNGAYSNADTNSTPVKTYQSLSVENIKSILKRLRTSPDDEGEQILRIMCKSAIFTETTNKDEYDSDNSH